MGEIQAENWTLLLEKWRQGDRAAYDRFIGEAYPEIKRLAFSVLRRFQGFCLTPTELAHEAYIKVAEYQGRGIWRQHEQFFGLVIRTMKNLLVDNSRKQKQRKNGGGWDHLPLSETILARDGAFDFQELSLALAGLEQLDKRRCEIWLCRHFGGLSIEELRDTFGLGSCMLHRELKAANGWLRHRLRGSRQ